MKLRKNVYGMAGGLATLFVAVVAVLVLSGCNGHDGDEHAAPMDTSTRAVPAETATPEAAPKTAEVAQKLCPVMGTPIDKDIYVDHNGRRVYLCCQMCVDQFKKEPEKYLKKLDEQLQVKPSGHEGAPHKESGAHEGHERH